MIQNLLLVPSSIREDDIFRHLPTLLNTNTSFHYLYMLEHTFNHLVLTPLNDQKVCIDKKWSTKQNNRYNELIYALQNELPPKIGSNFASLDEGLLQLMVAKRLYVTKDKEQLKALSNKDPVYKMMKKLLNAQSFQKQWVDKLIPYYDEDNKRYELTGRWRSYTSYSGRITAKQLPLTSMPNQMKELMIPYHQENNLWSLDLSNPELRFLAAYSRDEQLIDDLSNGRDVHSIVGTVFQNHLRHTDTHHNHRKAAKTFIFAMLYGAGDARLHETLVKNGYSVNRDEIHQVKRMIFNRYQSIEAYFQTVESTPNVNCFFGTICPMVNMRASQKRNFALQSSIATSIKILAILAAEMRLKIVCIIHDELIVEVPKTCPTSWQGELLTQFTHTIKHFHPALPIENILQIKLHGGYLNNEKL